MSDMDVEPDEPDATRTTAPADVEPLSDEEGEEQLVGDEQEVSARLAHRWERALAAFLPLLPQDALALVLKNADTTFVKQAMQALGLAKKWRRLQPRSNPRALLSIAADVSRILSEVDRRRRVAVPASKIVFTWWARRARLEFRETPLGDALSQAPLPYGLARAIEWLRADESDLARGVLERLAQLESSSDRLDRLFVEVLRAGREGVSEADLTARLAAIQSAVPVEPTLGSPNTPDNSLVPQHVQPQTPIEEHISKHPAVAGGFISAPGISDHRQGTEAVRAALAQCRIASDNLKAADHGDFTTLGKAFDRLKEAREFAAATIEGFADLIRQAELEVPVVTDAVFANEVAAEAHLAQLEGQLAKVESRSLQRLEAARDALAREFTLLGVPIPEQLNAATSSGEIAALQSEWRQELVALHLLRELSTWPNTLPSAFRELSAGRRLDLYERLLRLPASEVAAERLLRWLATDADAMKISPERGLDVLTKSIINALEYVVPLPVGTWSLYATLAGDRLLDSIVSSGLGTALATVPQELLDIESLSALDGLDDKKLPPALRITLRRHRLLSGAADNAVALLSDLAIEAELDSATLDALIRLLLKSHRHGEAVALAVLAERAAVYSSNRQEIPSALAAVLVDAVARDDASRELVRTVLEQGDADWLIELPEGVPILLYLTAKTGAIRPWTELRYQFPDTLLAASKARPVLTGRWLIGSALSDSPEGHRQQRDAAAADGAEALREYEEDLQRRSVYTAWSPGIDHQKFFNQQLRRVFQAIESGSPYTMPTPEDLLEAAVAQGCAIAEGRVRQRMLEYLSSQTDRLQRIASARQILGSDAGIAVSFTREAVPLREALLEEAKTVLADSTIAHLYARAIQETS